MEIEWEGVSGVYVLSNGGLHKIGMSANVCARIETLRRSFPASRLVHVLPTGQPKRLESLLHHRFARQRRTGEWFDLTPDDIEVLKNLDIVEFMATATLPPPREPQKPAPPRRKRPLGIMVTLKQFLSGLREAERAKPPKQPRREVPTMAELAEAAGLTAQAVSNLSANRVEYISLPMLAFIIGELRHRGFDVQIQDVLAYEPVPIDELRRGSSARQQRHNPAAP